MATRVAIKRGSLKLGARSGNAKAFELGVKRLQSLAKKKGIRVADWIINGTPVPDGIYGRLQVKPELAGSLIRELIKIKGLGIKGDFFPLGIVNPMESVMIEFKGGNPFGGQLNSNG